MFNPKPTVLALGLMIAALCAAPASRAEEQTPAGAPPAATQTVPPQAAPALREFTQEQVDSYARSAVKINDLLTTMEPQIKAAATPEKRQELNKTLQTRMMDIVAKDGGLSVQDYNAISMQVRADEKLAYRVVEAVKKEQGPE